MEAGGQRGGIGEHEAGGGALGEARLGLGEGEKCQHPRLHAGGGAAHRAAGKRGGGGLGPFFAPARKQAASAAGNKQALGPGGELELAPGGGESGVAPAVLGHLGQSGAAEAPGKIRGG